MQRRRESPCAAILGFSPVQVAAACHQLWWARELARIFRFSRDAFYVDRVMLAVKYFDQSQLYLLQAQMMLRMIVEML